MTALEFDAVVKDYRGLRPLRVADLAVGLHERVALSGLDVPAAEVFVNLATGATLPDQGEVRVMGQPTSAITEADLWLSSLDRFGVVSHRAVLLDGMSAAQNIAMSFSLSVDPIPAAIRHDVDALAAAVELTPAQLDMPAGALDAAGKVRVHLARALALAPTVLMLEHPTLHVDPGAVPALAAAIAAALSGRKLAVLALSNDDVVGKALGGRRLQLEAATGAVRNRSIFSGLRRTQRAGRR